MIPAELKLIIDELIYVLNVKTDLYLSLGGLENQNDCSYRISILDEGKRCGYVSINLYDYRYDNDEVRCDSRVVDEIISIDSDKLDKCLNVYCTYSDKNGISINHIHIHLSEYVFSSSLQSKFENFKFVLEQFNQKNLIEKEFEHKNGKPIEWMKR